MRDKAIVVEEKIDAWDIKNGMRLDVYHALIEYKEFAGKTGEWFKLNAE
jgi:hypothetical protein